MSGSAEPPPSGEATAAATAERHDTPVDVGAASALEAEPTPLTEREVRIRAALSTSAAALEGEFGTQSPLERLFGPTIERSELEAALNAELVLRADYHTECVRSEGFDWFEEPPEVRTLSTLGTGPLPDDSNALLTHGYGASWQLHQFLELRTNGAPTTPELRARAELISKLSEAELAVYSDVYGKCQTEAYEAFPGDTATGAVALSVEVGREISQISAEIARNPAFDLIWQDWSDCMRAKGYGFETRTDAFGYLSEIAAPLLSDLGQSPPEVPQQIRDRIAEFDRLEHAIVLDDLECAIDVDLDRRRIELQYRLEEEALAENADRWSLTLLEDEATADE